MSALGQDLRYGARMIVNGGPVTVVAIITLAGGLTLYLSVEVFVGVQGGGATQSPRNTSAGTFEKGLAAMSSGALSHGSVQCGSIFFSRPFSCATTITSRA